MEPGFFLWIALVSGIFATLLGGIAAGIEVGLILAAIPLAIMGLEQIRKR